MDEDGEICHNASMEAVVPTKTVAKEAKKVSAVSTIHDLNHETKPGTRKRLLCRYTTVTFADFFILLCYVHLQRR